MKRKLSVWITLILICTSVCLSSFSVSAADDAQTAQDDLAQTVAQALTNAVPADSEDLAEMLQGKQVTSILFLSPEQIETISDLLCREADIYLVELKDGHKTYYMAIDFHTPEAAYYSNLFVLRSTSRKLLSRSEDLAKRANLDYVKLMDYPHIIGELAIHYLAYRVTDGLGGEQLTGVLGKVYKLSSVADLNIDEARMPILIRIVGLMIG